MDIYEEPNSYIVLNKKLNKTSNINMIRNKNKDIFSNRRSIKSLERPHSI